MYNTMKRFTLLLCAALLTLGACGQKETTGTKDKEEEKKDEVTFYKGADISWVTEMESKGNRFYNAKGEERDCFVLMKELGLNAVRLRVWVNPSDGWCGRSDFLAKAKRAAAQGLDIMVDFHYSDSWADPQMQYKPAAWEGKSLKELMIALSDHTSEIMNDLKSAGITPKWVQIGNEIRPGMLWDTDASISGAAYDVTQNGKTFKANFTNLVSFLNTGYAAVKAVFPDTIVIIHLDNGYDNSLYTYYFDKVKSLGGKWDMIGMSIYPYWTKQSKPEYEADQVITDCINNIKLVSTRYDCDVMIVETGVECADGNGNLASDTVLKEGYRQMARIVDESLNGTSGRCKGVFYWEPECKPGTYRLGAFTADGRPTVIMDAFK